MEFSSLAKGGWQNRPATRADTPADRLAANIGVWPALFRSVVVIAFIVNELVVR
jgi:hypothetical protein